MFVGALYFANIASQNSMLPKCGRKYRLFTKLITFAFWRILSYWWCGATRSIPRDEGAEKLYGSPTVGPRPEVWTRGLTWKK